jgi:5'-deoxynucleotidase YfbR-like HD superfamily hydrolase
MDASEAKTTDKPLCGGSWVGTASGRKVDFLAPDPEQITIEDIATGLANVCRFGGQVDAHYSVAQHCVLASFLVPKGDELAALLHDAEEAYTGDCPRPLKHLLGAKWREVQDRLSAVILTKFGLASKLPATVKETDNRLLVTERDQFQPRGPEWTGAWLDGVAPYAIAIKPMTPAEARRVFLERFAELTGEPVLLKFPGGESSPEPVTPAPEDKPIAHGNLPAASAARNEYPMADGLLYYFPAALAEVARVSKIGNDQHNPGEPMHWARGKSTDHANKIMRHLLDAGDTDVDDTRHTAKVAWRALAMLQEELERDAGAPLPRNARLPKDSELSLAT